MKCLRINQVPNDLSAVTVEEILDATPSWKLHFFRCRLAKANWVTCTNFGSSTKSAKARVLYLKQVVLVSPWILNAIHSWMGRSLSSLPSACSSQTRKSYKLIYHFWIFIQTHLKVPLSAVQLQTLDRYLKRPLFRPSGAYRFRYFRIHGYGLMEDEVVDGLNETCRRPLRGH